MHILVFILSEDTEESCRPGILKKVHGGDQVVTESTSTSSATVISSRGTLKADGTVSLKRDIIQGEYKTKVWLHVFNSLCLEIVMLLTNPPDC